MWIQSCNLTSWNEIVLLTKCRCFAEILHHRDKFQYDPRIYAKISLCGVYYRCFQRRLCAVHISRLSIIIVPLRDLSNNIWWLADTLKLLFSTFPVLSFISPLMSAVSILLLKPGTKLVARTENIQNFLYFVYRACWQYVNNTEFPNLHAQFSFSLLYSFRPNKRPSSGDVQYWLVPSILSCSHVISLQMS